MDIPGGGVIYRELFMRGEIMEPTLAVVRSASTFQRVWETAHSMFGDMKHPGQPCVPPLPDIDWTRDIIIAAALGQRPTITGYSIYLSLSEDRDGLHVLVHEGHPDPGMVQLDAVGYPTVLVAIETDAAEVAFHVQHPVVNYEPTAEQQDVRQKAYDLWQRTQRDV